MSQSYHNNGAAAANSPVSVNVKGTCVIVVCQPNEYLVKTGMGVNDMTWGKKAFKAPFQKITRIDMAPRNYHFALNNMSSEMVPFQLPVVFTIGPYDPTLDGERFLVYARRMSGLTEAELTQVVAGVIHGQTRVYTAALTIREMFEDRDKFKHAVQERIQKDLNQYGLFIYNANIAEMKDLDERNKYFENLKQKALEGANTEARIQVAEARKLGDIGEKERQGDVTVRTAQIEANVTANANAREEEIAKSQLALELVRTECKKQEDIAAVQAQYVTKQQEVELQIEYEKLQALKEVERLRATDLTNATVSAEVTIKAAEAEAQAVRTRADAHLYAELKKAEAIKATRNAQAESLATLLATFGNRPELALYYVSMENGLYDRMAAQTAAAVKGLNPKISVWNTGDAANGGGMDAMGHVRQMLGGLPPMLDAIQNHAGVSLPSWMPSMDSNAPAAASAAAPAAAPAVASGSRN